MDGVLRAFPTLDPPALLGDQCMPEIRPGLSVLSQGTWVKATDIASRQSWEDSAQPLRYFVTLGIPLFLCLPTRDTLEWPSTWLPAAPISLVSWAGMMSVVPS